MEESGCMLFAMFVQKDRMYQTETALDSFYWADGGRSISGSEMNEQHFKRLNQ